MLRPMALRCLIKSFGKDGRTGLSQPTSMAFLSAPNRLLRARENPAIQRVTNGAVQSTVLDLAVDSASERGIAGSALHPNPSMAYAYCTDRKSSDRADPRLPTAVLQPRDRTYGRSSIATVMHAYRRCITFAGNSSTESHSEVADGSFLRWAIAEYRIVPSAPRPLPKDLDQHRRALAGAITVV